jgi:hypothetical protein
MCDLLACSNFLSFLHCFLCLSSLLTMAVLQAFLSHIYFSSVSLLFRLLVTGISRFWVWAKCARDLSRLHLWGYHSAETSSENYFFLILFFLFFCFELFVQWLEWTECGFSAEIRVWAFLGFWVFLGVGGGGTVASRCTVIILRSIVLPTYSVQVTLYSLTKELEFWFLDVTTFVSQF